MWIEEINQDFVIITGDGAEFKPFWINAQKSKEFNYKAFEYPETAGAYVERKQPQATKLDLKLFFQGENNLEEANMFWESANNAKPWSITHPLYGALSVQPISLTFNDKNFNVTEITAPVIETNEEAGPEVSTDVSAQVINQGETANQQAAQGYAANAQPTAEDVASMKKTVETVQSNASNNLPTDQVNAFKNSASQALGKIESATAKPAQAITALQNVIGFPAQIQASVQNRLGILQKNFDSLLPTANEQASANQKLQKEKEIAANLTAQAVAAITPQKNDYKVRADILQISEQLQKNYGAYIAKLNGLQTQRTGRPESFAPDFALQYNLELTINRAVGNLFRRVFDLKREKVYETKSETNIFLLTHALYGLDEEDENINQLINQNAFNQEEFFVIPAGRKVVYYA